jgi:hypothetical protein
MDLHVNEMETTVRAVDDRTLLSPDVMEVVVREVLARLRDQQEQAARARDDRTLWQSVREGRARP